MVDWQEMMNRLMEPGEGRTYADMVIICRDEMEEEINDHFQVLQEIKDGLSYMVRPEGYMVHVKIEESVVYA